MAFKGVKFLNPERTLGKKTVAIHLVTILRLINLYYIVLRYTYLTTAATTHCYY